MRKASTHATGLLPCRAAVLCRCCQTALSRTCARCSAGEVQSRRGLVFVFLGLHRFPMYMDAKGSSYKLQQLQECILRACRGAEKQQPAPVTCEGEPDQRQWPREQIQVNSKDAICGEACHRMNGDLVRAAWLLNCLIRTIVAALKHGSQAVRNTASRLWSQGLVCHTTHTTRWLL